MALLSRMATYGSATRGILLYLDWLYTLMLSGCYYEAKLDDSCFARSTLTSQRPTIFDYPYLHRLLPENKYLVHLVKNVQQPSKPARAAAINCHVESVEKSPKKLIQQPSRSSLSVTLLIHARALAQYTQPCV